MTRRRFVLGTAALAAAATTTSLVAYSSSTDHVEAAGNQRLPRAVSNSDRALLWRELVRYATLAPSSHNTQCWKFRIQDSLITIEPDLARRCPVVDPDDHHLFVSLGCAAENLVQAALANGLQANASFDPSAIGVISISLEATKTRASPLFQAISERQCTRGDFDGKPLSVEDLHLLEQAGRGNGVQLILLTERSVMENVLEYVMSGNTNQLNNPAFVKELKAWIRFSHDEAVLTGDGLFAGSSGSPALPRWLGSRLMDLFLTSKSENERYARQVRSSAGIAIFASEANDKAHWIEAGRCYERFALQATALGIRNSLLNQPVEVGSIRPQFASALNLGHWRPDLVVRFGRGPTLPWSMRRPVESVMV